MVASREVNSLEPTVSKSKLFRPNGGAVLFSAPQVVLPARLSESGSISGEPRKDISIGLFVFPSLSPFLFHFFFIVFSPSIPSSFSLTLSRFLPLSVCVSRVCMRLCSFAYFTAPFPFFALSYPLPPLFTIFLLSHSSPFLYFFPFFNTIVKNKN